MPIDPTTPQKLRCLSIQQPWAWMVCSGDKDIENRNWKTDFRGTIAIHASTKETQVNAFLKRDKLKQVTRNDFAFGAIIGLADIESISVYGKEHESNPHASGPYCWKLTNGHFLKNPIPIPGKLGLVYLSEELTEQILLQETFQFPADSPIRTMLRGNMEANPSALDLYEYCLIDLGAKASTDELLQIANRMIELDPNYASVHLYRIDLADLNPGVSLPADHLEAYEAAVLATYGDGSNDQQLRSGYEQSLENPDNPENPDGVNHLGYDSSVFYQALPIHLHELAIRFLKQAQHDKALAYGKRRFALESDVPEAHVDLGEIYLDGLSDTASALKSLRTALMLCDFGRDPNAELRIASYVDEDPESERALMARLLLLLSRAFREVGEVDEAMTVASRLVKIDKENPLAFVEAYKVATQKNDPKLAKKYRKKALELDPEIGNALGD